MRIFKTKETEVQRNRTMRSHGIWRRYAIEKIDAGKKVRNAGYPGSYLEVYGLVPARKVL